MARIERAGGRRAARFLPLLAVLAGQACRAPEALEPPSGRLGPELPVGAPRLEPRVERDARGSVLAAWTVLVHPSGQVERHGVDRRWYGDGTCGSEREFDHDRPTGRWTSWWPDGSLRSEYLHLGEVATVMRFYHASGRPSAEGLARGGVREGEWRFWFEDGTPEKEGSYAGGLREGIWTLRHPGGGLRSRGRYQGDARVGEWRHWPAVPAVPESPWTPPAPSIPDPERTPARRH